MAEPKNKSEYYALLGGINVKSSKYSAAPIALQNYSTSPIEFLDLQNFNFNRPNSISSRDGMTNYCGLDGNPAGASLGMITGVHEDAELSGFSMMVLAGMSNIMGYGSFGSTIFVANTRTSSASPVPLMDMETFVNHLFFCNGQVMQKYSASFGLENYTLPPGTLFTDNNGNPGNIYLTGSTYLGAPGASGYFGFAYGYLNDRGYLGPAINVGGISLMPGLGAVITGLTAPSGYGITAIAIYMTEPDLVDLFPAPIQFIPPGATYFFLSEQYMPAGALGSLNPFTPVNINYGVTLYNSQPITYFPGRVNLLNVWNPVFGATYYTPGNLSLPTPGAVSLITPSLAIAIQASFGGLGGGSGGSCAR